MPSHQLRSRTLGVLVALSAVSGPFRSSLAESERTSYFNQHWLDAVISIEQETSKGRIPLGTGFLVGYANKVFLVTAKHVIAATGTLSSDLSFRRSDMPDGQLFPVAEWNVSASNLDVAFLQVGWKSTDRSVTSIPLSEFLSRDGLQVGAPILVLGFPAGLRSDELREPIARSGIVARVSLPGITLDAPVFPGNSGGPVVYAPLIKVGAPISSGVVNSERLVGMVVTTQLSQYSDKVGSFRSFLGLAGMIPADLIKDFLELRLGPKSH
jgi:S1-C subfamily serine protease